VLWYLEPAPGSAVSVRSRRVLRQLHAVTLHLMPRVAKRNFQNDVGVQPVDGKAQLERGREIAQQLRAKDGWQVVMEADGQRIE